MIGHFVAGGAAGFAVDMALFPLDTIKTRLQAKGGFFSNGGFKHIYAGLSSTAIGSVPGAALFFLTYEYSKRTLYQFTENESSLTKVDLNKQQSSWIHIISAMAGESVACLVRVPTEMVKQRMQANTMLKKHGNTLKGTVKAIYNQKLGSSGGLMAFYKGYPVTILREFPFCMVQFPLFEHLKATLPKFDVNYSSTIDVQDGLVYGDTDMIQSTQSIANYFRTGIIGSISGATAAIVTTPIDVIKTRIMLNQGTALYNRSSSSLSQNVSLVVEIYKTEGPKTFIKGIGPRSLWIGIGGFIFFSVYETTLSYI